MYKKLPSEISECIAKGRGKSVWVGKWGRQYRLTKSYVYRI